MSRKTMLLASFALAPLLIAALAVYADGTFVNADAETKDISSSEYYTTIHTRHDWDVETLLHSVDVRSRYYCFVMGEQTLSSPLLYNNDLGPGLISGGGDMWSFWSLDPGSHATKASTFMSADDRFVLGDTNWTVLSVP